MSSDSEEEDHAAAIEARIERLRRMRGWTDDTVTKAPPVPPPPPAVKEREPLSLAWHDLREGVREYEVDSDSFEIGTSDRAHLRLLDPSLSGRHARISWDDGTYRVRDMNSSSGTFVNEQPVPLSQELADGDELRLGEVCFRVSIGYAPSERRAPEPEPAPRPAAPPPAPRAGTLDASATVMMPPSNRGTPRPSAEFASLEPAPTALVSPGRGIEPRSTRPEPRPTPTRPAPRAEAATATLSMTFTEAGEAPREVLLAPPGRLLIGRRKDNDLFLTDASVSGRHCMVEWAGGEVVVRDLGSTNGTFVNEERVSQQVLVDGDELMLGTFLIHIALLVN